MTSDSRPAGSATSAEAVAVHSRLEHFPISFFAVAMGLSGLTLVALRVEHAAGLERFSSVVMLFVTMMVFAAIAVTYLVKLARYPAAVTGEWNHPVRIAFFPAASISVILIGTAMSVIWPGLAQVLWAGGTAAQLVATLAVVSAWISHRQFEAVHLNPAWFIPAVGNVLVPIAGMRFGHVETSWFFFTTGMLFWLVLLTLVFNRLIFHAPLPQRLMPTLMILIAPPAVGFLSYRALSGDLDGFARILYYAAVLFALVLATQIGKLRRLPFVMSWWAYSFPLAALTVATFSYAEAVGSTVHLTAAYALACLTAAVIAMLVVLTLRAMSAGEICQPE